MTQLQHLQKVILSIMKDIDELCVKNDIEYYLLGGSAIGAVRHHGFIPWDDDLDIIMTDDNYRKFLTIARTSLDSKKYYLQEGLKDWELNFTKVKLRGTYIKEVEIDENCDNEHGIFVDIFKLDNVPDNRIAQILQYICAKYYLAYTLSVRGYKTATKLKKLIMATTIPLRSKKIREFILHQVEKYNNITTNYYGFFFGRTRLKTSITRKEIYGKPMRVRFENLMLPIEEKYDEYLTQIFGDYMQLPPESQRVSSHMIEIDFGKN